MVRLRQPGAVGAARAGAAPLATVQLAVRKFDGSEKRIGGEIADHAHKAFGPAIYARAGFEELFR